MIINKPTKRAKAIEFKGQLRDPSPIWSDILNYYYSLSQDKQDEIMLNIYRQLIENKQKQKHYSVLVSTKAYT